MTTNRSSEELAMRAAIEEWGRKRWPDARVVHELVVSDCRIDMAFIGRSHLVGVEIKSGKDTLDRLEKQALVFRRHLPEVWIAYAPKWIDHVSKAHYDIGQLLVAGSVVDENIPFGRGYVSSHPARVRMGVTTPMLDLLWRAEALAIASRMQVPCSNRTPLYTLVPALARKLTGDEIVREVCRELRNRDAFWKSDPIKGEAA